MTATWSEHDQHDDQIMHAAHEALRPMTATRFRPVPGMTPAEGAPPKVMISSEGTGMHADSATMSRNATAYPQMAMRCCTELLSDLDDTGGGRAAEGHDQLGGDRYARRFRDHEQERDGVPADGYEVLHGIAFLQSRAGDALGIT